MALSDLSKKVDELLKHKVKTGWDANAKYMDTGQQIAQVALWQEYGTNIIPPRPFIRPALANNKMDWAKHSKILANRYLVGRKIELEGVFNGAGTEMVADIRKTLDSRPNDLSKTTLLLRRWKDEGETITGTTVRYAIQVLKDNPNEPLSTRIEVLHDSGQMRSKLDSTMVDV